MPVRLGSVPAAISGTNWTADYLFTNANPTGTYQVKLERTDKVVKQVEEAIQRALSGFQETRRLTAEERARILVRMRDGLAARNTQSA